ncbi:flavodoxin-dependent (E)-4-hydroxy-3-methylbut-2-enyl-diphosphate synthase [Zongyangia hominis]|uniref:4-hydroxy-3-methylbut-2-en-1-yl diphosphate synthase (flavodoxin) n=1 Tax=Zongyangia hominis TaxID=2763677 RepID=A0A926EB03_9FIRM|nr:flavodoxin-dependent (E)-4-hydroxy-3-methylbut-2-enyl-diphosphate synthase [Zongyangia hominis]MBC8569710.1 flavodoxin-dependent (E)-4-hydroxy-3-methylbut-2-enyl-diphosphate synthase [Zongyangia hominis]
MIERRKTRSVRVGDVIIGSEAPVVIQSMLSAPSYDLNGNISQAIKLKEAGCQIIRIAVPDHDAVKLIGELKRRVGLPVVADIHFDYRLALESVEAGVDKVRINPGNIGGEDRVKAVAEACKSAGVPIRIGVNSGSIEREILAKHGGPTPDAMVESARYHCSLLEKYDFTDIVLSLKSSNVVDMIEAYEKIARLCDYPLHLGVTEAGTKEMGVVKSAVGIGSLLTRGIGDTIRVSLTDDPVEEIRAAQNILRSIGYYRKGVTLVSCPTCGRTRINLIELAGQVEEALRGVEKPLTVAVMGCVVNGPGEASQADIGVAGGDGCAVLFKKGQILRKIPEENILQELLAEIEKL